MTALMLLIACDATVDTDSAAPIDETPSALWEPVGYSGGACPSFSPEEEWVDLVSAELDRSVRVLYPENPQGAPVWFNWHWLGGSANQAVTYQGLYDIADAGYIVVVPTTTGKFEGISEWGFVDGQDDSWDLALFDDVLSCLVEQHDIDRSRVYSTGMSAGGLWSTHLLGRRSEYLAAVAPLSGGTGMFQSYDKPERGDLPVMLTWGGPSDTINILGQQVSFEEATFELRDALLADGHFVIMCEHDDGHTLPPVNLEHVKLFFAAQQMGEDNPWEGGLPGELWSACEIAE